MSRGAWHNTPEGRRRDKQAEKFGNAISDAIFGSIKEAIKDEKKRQKTYTKKKKGLFF